jgi:alkylated DNA nucleotide flippase Atl1
LANAANPVAIVVPCHRVIGTDGSLTGYGGGISRKRWLLTHEGVALKKVLTEVKTSANASGRERLRRADVSACTDDRNQ